MILAEPPQTHYDLNFAVAGVPVRVHPMFWLGAVLLGASNRNPVDLLIWVAAVFLSVLVHEFGHSMAMRYFGWTSHIVLLAFGGLAIQDSGIGRYGRGGRDARTQIIISFAGPAAGFLLAALILAALRASGNPAGVTPGGFPPFLPYFNDIEPRQLETFVWDLLVCNIFWGLLNLLPIYPLDGGQIAQQVLVTSNPRDGLQQAFLLSIFTAAGVAILAYVKLNSLYMTIFFGYMAYQNYTILQSFRGGGYGGGRGW